LASQEGQRVQLKIADIDASDRLREIDPDWVEVLATSIRQIGLRQAVEVRPRGDGHYKLTSGGHRLAACQQAGLEEIDAEVREIDEYEARLAEIDENLFRHELKPLDRAAFLAERQRLYEQLHPETAGGVAGAKAKQGAKLMFSFADATAEATGLGKSTIKRAVSIYRRLDGEVRWRLSGMKLRESDLHKLSQYAPETQRAIADALLRDDAPAGSVKAAAAEVLGKNDGPADDADTHFQRLVQAYQRAPAKAQARFREWLNGGDDASRGEE